MRGAANETGAAGVVREIGGASDIGGASGRSSSEGDGDGLGAQAPTFAPIEGLSVVRAVRLRERMAGLLGKAHLPRDTALWISPCRSIHTLGMRFPIDLVFLDRDRRIVRLDESVPPGRFRACWQARSVVEMAAFAASDRRLAVGQIWPDEIGSPVSTRRSSLAVAPDGSTSRRQDESSSRRASIHWQARWPGLSQRASLRSRP